MFIPKLKGSGTPKFQRAMIFPKSSHSVCAQNSSEAEVSAPPCGVMWPKPAPPLRGHPCPPLALSWSCITPWAFWEMPGSLPLSPCTYARLPERNPAFLWQIHIHSSRLISTASSCVTFPGCPGQSEESPHAANRGFTWRPGGSESENPCGSRLRGCAAATLLFPNLGACALTQNPGVRYHGRASAWSQ